MLIGFVFAAVSAAVAVKWMVGYLNRHSLAIFGIYRLVLAAAATLFVGRLMP
jgi:undecaprenyl-diphosphatase